ncbi:MAG: multidrug DMT transporter permease [Thermoplasmatales archaeon SG8-52-3]|nr:MAG: multidrug DMT transporter permease [Thermoplasmatales archaeon SG8-52-3]
MIKVKNNLIKLNFSSLKFFIMMLIMVIVWAFAFPFIKIGLEELSFINLTIMRFFIVCCVLPFILLFQKKRISKLQKKDILPIFLLGFFGVIIYHLGLNYGEQYISPAAASLIIATIPVQIVILAIFFLREKISLIKGLGVIIAMAGVVVISIWGKIESTIKVEYIYGAIAVLIAALMGALYTILGKKLLDRYTGLSLTIYAILFGSIGLIPFLSHSLIEQVFVMSINAWFSVLFLGLFSTIIGYIAWYVALEKKTASEISIFLYAIPVFSTIFSYFIFNDEITIMFVFGGVLVIAGLAIVNMKNNKKID